MDDLKMFVVNDGEEHRAVAVTADEALGVVGEHMIGGGSPWEDEYGPAWREQLEVSEADPDEVVLVHYPDASWAAEVVPNPNMLAVEDDEGDRYELRGTVRDWIEAMRENAPAFVSSTVF